jgi:3-dehydroquinate synthase/shikimate kinase/3-dehydroquinate synthase
VQVPTTLLAMVDSSVGGKTGVNHPLGKNMIGSFHQPRAVIISLAALETLPREEYLAGLAEVAKYAVIRDPALFAYLEQNAAAVLAREPAALERIIRTSCAIKAAVVGDDERETGEGGRAILNYGHTFGHAFEYLAGYKDLPHGLAVALGMRCAAGLSARLGLWTEAERARHDALLDLLEFPRRFKGRFDAEAAWEATGRDKKAEKGRRVFILPRAIGAVESVANPPRDDVMAAFRSVAHDGGAA